MPLETHGGFHYFFFCSLSVPYALCTFLFFFCAADAVTLRSPLNLCYAYNFRAYFNTWEYIYIIQGMKEAV